MELDELTAREAIREVVAAYSHHADSGRFDELVALFSADGVLEIKGEPVVAGRDAIRAYLGGVGRDLAGTSTTQMIRHFVANLTIEVTAPVEARGECYFLVITDSGVDHWGRYRDVYTREDDAWLFARRAVTTDGFVPGGFAATRRLQ
jgi:ketosteroid isomerase-like protein